MITIVFREQKGLPLILQKQKNNKPLTLFIMKKFIAALAIVLFTVSLTSYNNTGDDQIAGDNNSTQTQEPGSQGGGGGVVVAGGL